MELQTVFVDDLKPYENNPRFNDDAVEAVAESIRQCGYCAPIVTDENFVILAGHTRYKALLKLGIEQVQVAVVGGLTEEQKKKYRLLDNKTGENAVWDFSKLDEELEGLDFDGFDFEWPDFYETEKKAENPYTAKTDIPQYEPTGEVADIEDLVDTGKADSLIEIINASDIPEDDKEFLRKAACRHYVFNYKKIAEYYVQAPKEVQELFEQSALVIIDYEDAIKNGYAKLSSDIKEMLEADANSV